MNTNILTSEERHALNVLNYIVTYDGIITSEDEIKYLLQQGIEKFIAKKRQHLVRIRESYPIKIVIKPNRKDVKGE